MENITFILVGGVVGFVCLLSFEFILYRRYKQAKAALISKIDEAENELQEDIRQLDISELNQTKSGKELLILLNNNDTEVNTKHSAQRQNLIVPKFQWNNPFKFSNMPTIGLIVATVLFGFLIGTSGFTFFLNPEIAAAEANRINIETAHQQATYELQERLAQAQTDSEIQSLQMEQQILIAQHELLAQSIEDRRKMIEVQQASISVVSICIPLIIFTITTSNIKQSLIAKRRYKRNNRADNSLWASTEYRRTAIMRARQVERATRQAKEKKTAEIK